MGPPNSHTLEFCQVSESSDVSASSTFADDVGRSWAWAVGRFSRCGSRPCSSLVLSCAASWVLMPQGSSTTTYPYVGLPLKPCPAGHVSRLVRVKARTRLLCALVPRYLDRELVRGGGGGALTARLQRQVRPWVKARWRIQKQA